MSKFKSALAGVLILGEAIAIIYFAAQSQNLSQKLKHIKPDYEKVEKEAREAKDKYAGILKEFDALKNESEALRQDRDNLLVRAKTLLADTSRLKELEESVGKIKKDKETLEKESQDLQSHNFELNAEIKRLLGEQAQVAQERDQLKSVFEKSNKDNTVKELRGEIASLQKEKSEQATRLQKVNKDTESDLRKAQKDIAQLKEQKSKLDKEVESLDAELKDYKANYAQAQKKNKALETEVQNTPKKFTEIARQNKVLIKNTSQMHYNLGVFYTKNKEYDRAIAEFEKVVEITPDDAYAHFNLGYIYAEYLVNRKKAIENFRHYLRLAKGDDKDVDWVKKYLITWETYEGKTVMK